jgi:exosome complex component RRP4
MGQLLVKEKEIAVPGDELAIGMDYLPGVYTYRDDDKIIALKLGIVNISGRAIKIIPLSGKYIPKKGDIIIGKIVDVSLFGWRIDTNCAYPAMLNVKDATSEYIAKGADLTKFFNFGDYIVTKIINVTSQKLIDLTMKGPGLRKLKNGRIIDINTNKVPRIIGKQGSMVSLIKKETGCNIIVGQNGLIWVSGNPKNEIIAINAINKIEKESHTEGLTDRIKAYLEKELKK